jgi:hypothetical protein
LNAVIGFRDRSRRLTGSVIGFAVFVLGVLTVRPPATAELVFGIVLQAVGVMVALGALLRSRHSIGLSAHGTD